MKKNIFWALILIISVISCPVFAEDSAETKAQEVHKLATSDIIYSQEEVKALYYQNVEIINLLKEIRDILQTRSEQK